MDESTLDPWVEHWIRANPMFVTPMEDLSPELLGMARSQGGPPSVTIAEVTDDTVEGVPVRIYRDGPECSGLVVYFHGGAWAVGSIGLMDNIARQICKQAGAVVVSVEYRLAPEHPFPAGFLDCEAVTRWCLANAERFGVTPDRVAVAGESAGGNLATAVALVVPGLAGQVLVYPATDGPALAGSSWDDFDGLVLSRKSFAVVWEAYGGGADIDDDPRAVPMRAERLDDLPPALVLLGGCDTLRDEGRAYAAKMRDSGVEVEEVCFAGQPHGFVNFDFPAAADAFARIGVWLRDVFRG